MTDINSLIQGSASIVSNDNAAIHISLSGYWTKAAQIASTSDIFSALQKQSAQQTVKVTVQNVQDWDSRLPAFLLKISRHCQALGLSIDFSALPEGIQALLQLAGAVPEKESKGATKKPFILPVVVGEYVLYGYRFSREWLQFIGELMVAFGAFLQGKARFRSADIWLCIQETGPAALPIVTLISLLVGLILAFVGAVQLSMFGAQVFIADLVGLGTVREMGALMTAIIMTGRTGAAYAAQLGTMQVNSEIDALKTMGISAMEFLVIPRILALILMMPLLVLYANVVGIVGGAVVTFSAFDVSLAQYYNEVSRAVHLNDFAIGLAKSMVFAALIALAGCLHGMQCGRSASAVGDATTAAVVSSIVLIVIADSLLTLLCNRLAI